MACFFDLPAEIRNIIYEMVVEPRRLMPMNEGGRHHKCNTSAILAVNREIRFEAAPVAYAKTDVYFDLSYIDKIMDWYSSLSDGSRAALRSLRYSRVLTTSSRALKRIDEITDTVVNWAVSYGVEIRRSIIQFRLVNAKPDGEWKSFAKQAQSSGTVQPQTGA